MNKRALLYAAQEIAFPDKEWVLKPYTDFDGATYNDHLVVCVKDYPCWVDINRFDPLESNDDWVALREGLELKKDIVLFPCGDVYNVVIMPQGMVMLGEATPKTIEPTLDNIRSLKNKCPRTLALDICAVLAGDDDG